MSSESPGGTQSQLLYSRLLDSWIGKKKLNKLESDKFTLLGRKSYWGLVFYHTKLKAIQK